MTNCPDFCRGINSFRQEESASPGAEEGQGGPPPQVEASGMKREIKEKEEADHWAKVTSLAAKLVDAEGASAADPGAGALHGLQALAAGIPSPRTQQQMLMQQQMPPPPPPPLLPWTFPGVACMSMRGGSTEGQRMKEAAEAILGAQGAEGVSVLFDRTPSVGV